ncbi:hypothetical protein MOPEL_130_01900 [Mobilicoccus pelagius NBRC 104925]|uniref:MEMO1 family protein MOPEL_130_01900 n=1 Tax=Mobilicoccus pelagius NBRC 104925 TaxID=1089455 RepID=H5UV25_9MICO|nr:hypothetical protein MOPEL_130_01900 [Mobilicoccus pelagius NBRC 104925]
MRTPAVAGLFYDDDPDDLRASVDGLLDDARRRVPPAPEEDPATVRALLAPHAGYVYSGPTAAAGYLRVEACRDRISRVVLLGPVHRVPVRGLAHPEAAAFATPWGEVPVEPLSPELRASFPQLLDSRLAHAQEHSLEVHVPFLQRVLGEFTLLPLAVGGVGSKAVADVLDAVTSGADDEATMVVVSSDLSHYLPYDDARRVDAGTLAQIEALDARILPEQACGAAPLDGALTWARRHGLRPRIVEACNSGDTAGDRRRVVGYASATFSTGASSSESATTEVGA